MSCKTCKDSNTDSKFNCYSCCVRVGDFLWCVITEAEEKQGNLYDDSETLCDDRVIIHVKRQTFYKGEIFPVDPYFKREMCAAGRKPGKWDIGYRFFKPKDYAKAVLLAIKVSG